MSRLDKARKLDPAAFAQRMRMLERADALNTFLFGDRRFDGRLQQEFVAASMPTEALQEDHLLAFLGNGISNE